MTKNINKILIATFLLMIGFLGATTASAAWTTNYKFATYTPKAVEMRAVWVATVGQIDFGKQIGTGEAAINEWKGRYLQVLDNAEANNLNTIIFQIRPANDAFYPSKYNPWSEFLMAYGQDPGWDPLAWMIEVTHERGMEYHAWLNPYRASTGTLLEDISKTDTTAKVTKALDYDEEELNKYKDSFFTNLKAQTSKDYDNPIFDTGDALHDEVVLGMEDKFVLNPASPRVLKHLENTIGEIVDNYDIDGIHFDDYFYPDDATYDGTVPECKGYTFSTEPYKDMRDYQVYVSKGGTLSIYNWRRENINQLIKALSDIIREKNATKEVKCAFGISPCGRWAPEESCGVRGAEGGMVGSCNNYYAYSDLYADTKKWALEEWIDYLVPQVYSELDDSYDEVVEWWSDVLKDSKTKLYIGQPVFQIGTWGNVLEMLNQVRYNQTEKFNIDGYFFYNYTSTVSGKGANAMNGLVKSVWKRNTLTPTYAAYSYSNVVTGTPSITSIVAESNGALTINFTEADGAKAYLLKAYKENETYDSNIDDYVNLVQRGHTEITFTKTEGMKYVLIPVADDNSLSPNVAYVDLDKVIVNHIPEVTMDEFNHTVEPGTLMTFNCIINDDDNETFTVTAALSEDGKNFTRSLMNKSISEHTFSFIWKAYFSEQDGIYIKVTVNDGKDTCEYITEAISIVESKPITYNITYVLNDGILTNPINSYTYGVGLSTLPTPTKEGYTFLGWYENDTLRTNISNIDNENITLTAKWEKAIVNKTITYQLNGGQINGTYPNTYEVGKGITSLPTPVKDGYNFDGWYNNDLLVTSISSDETEDITLTAKWTEISKKGCAGCKKTSAEIMIQTLSLLSIALIIIIKKKEKF